MREIKATVQLGTGEEIQESELSDFHARNKATESERLRQAQAAAKNPFVLCPFSSAMTPKCNPDCALKIPQGCTLRFLADNHPTHETAGKRCPINGQACTPSCALYEKGCILTAI